MKLYSVFRSLANKRTIAKLTSINSYATFWEIIKNRGIKEAIRTSYDNIMNTDVVERVESISIPDLNEIPNETLNVPHFDYPLVSIIIPVYNNYALTHNSIKSIINHKCDTSYEIIVVDDCSTDFTKEITKQIIGIKVVKNETNRGFLKNCNMAASLSSAKYILLLNNDTHVCDSWLDKLVDVAESDGKIGIVGSKLIYPDGSLQEAGGIIWSNGSAWNYGHSSNPNCSEYSYIKDVDYISGASILIRKQYFDEIGGFDERYVPAYCEDSDLSMEMRKHGYRVVYQPRSVIYHFEGMSNGKLVTSGLKQYQVINNKKFYEKWKDVLTTSHCESPRQLFYARERSMGKKAILIIDSNVPMYDDNAGNRTVFDYIRCLLSIGSNVKLLAYDYANTNYSETIQSMGVEIVYGHTYQDRGLSWIAENGNFLDYVMIFRPEMAEYYLNTIKQHSKAKIYYNVADLHFLRVKREYELTKDSKLLKKSQKLEKKERKMMSLCDKCVTVSSYEYQIISNIIGKERTMVIPMYCFEKYDIGDREVPSDHSLMFVGGFSHNPNVDAVLFFVEKILPLVLVKIPDVKFYVIGSNVPDSIKNLQSDNVIVCGHVSEDDLFEHYRSCSISVIPLRFGAGVKGKVIEAMYHKIPIVSTSIGLEGIEDLTEILKPKDMPDEFANEIINIFNNPGYAKKMSDSYIDCIKKHYSMESMRELFSKEFHIEFNPV